METRNSEEPELRRVKIWVITGEKKDSDAESNYGKVKERLNEEMLWSSNQNSRETLDKLMQKRQDENYRDEFHGVRNGSPRSGISTLPTLSESCSPLVRLENKMA